MHNWEALYHCVSCGKIAAPFRQPCQQRLHGNNRVTHWVMAHSITNRNLVEAVLFIPVNLSGSSQSSGPANACRLAFKLGPSDHRWACTGEIFLRKYIVPVHGLHQQLPQQNCPPSTRDSVQDSCQCSHHIFACGMYFTGIISDSSWLKWKPDTCHDDG